MALFGDDLIRKYPAMQKIYSVNGFSLDFFCLYIIFWGKSLVWNWTWKFVTLSRGRYTLYLKKMLQLIRIIGLLKDLISHWLF